MKAVFIELYGRDILRLKDEINNYRDERSIWSIADGISNSGGNLCLHLVGNLNHFIGAALGRSGYKRERDKEFSTKDVPRETLISMVEKTRDIVISSLDSMNEADLKLDFPEQLNGKTLTNEFMLSHLLAHLSYHLGQINYHRRLLEK